MSKELIEKINALGFKKKKIETDLNMPLNSLSGMLKGNRAIPLKWAIKLSEYADSHNPNKKPLKDATTEIPIPPNEDEKKEKAIDLSRLNKGLIERRYRLTPKRMAISK